MSLTSTKEIVFVSKLQQFLFLTLQSVGFWRFSSSKNFLPSNTSEYLASSTQLFCHSSLNYFKIPPIKFSWRRWPEKIILSGENPYSKEGRKLDTGNLLVSTRSKKSADSKGTKSAGANRLIDFKEWVGDFIPHNFIHHIEPRN